MKTMSQSTNIEWTDATWNPTRGCSPVSPGCKNCYAERIAARFSTPRLECGGEDTPAGPWIASKPGTFQGLAIMTDHGPQWTGKVELIESKLLEPLHWRKPRRVFVNSMSDLFHENLPDKSIDRIFAVMALTPHINYQVLTKRARRMREYLSVANRRERILAAGFRDHCSFDAAMDQQWNRAIEIWPLPNVWLGVSVENQPTADKRISELLRTPAALRFVSYEPALAEVDFNHLQPGREVEIDCLNGTHGVLRPHGGTNTKLDWGIIGGESGPGARPFRLEWARDTIGQFKTAGVPLFVKQLGSNPLHSPYQGWEAPKSIRLHLKDSKGGDWDEWPEDLRVRQFPCVGEFAK